MVLSSRDKCVFAPVERLIADASSGRMIIMVDDEARENEGDLIIPANHITASAINFMVKFGRGLVCLAMLRAQAEKLELPMMEKRGCNPYGTAFTVSIDASTGIDTGVSAADRARTITVAVDHRSTSGDIVTPGHVFPLVARDGGVLERQGHTEAAVDIARMAGLSPAGVICEIMNDDGTMARIPDLVDFACYHGLSIGAITHLVDYRRRFELKL